MIKTFIHKGLEELWKNDRTAKINVSFHERILERLDALEVALRAEDMNLPGYDFHPLRGKKPVRYTVHVNGPWCITFEFFEGDAYKVNFEQYH